MKKLLHSFLALSKININQESSQYYGTGNNKTTVQIFKMSKDCPSTGVSSIFDRSESSFSFRQLLCITHVSFFLGSKNWICYTHHGNLLVHRGR